jgi:hypothetical protein
MQHLLNGHDHTSTLTTASYNPRVFTGRDANKLYRIGNCFYSIHFLQTSTVISTAKLPYNVVCSRTRIDKSVCTRIRESGFVVNPLEETIAGLHKGSTRREIIGKITAAWINNFQEMDLFAALHRPVKPYARNIQYDYQILPIVYTYQHVCRKGCGFGDCEPGCEWSACRR